MSEDRRILIISSIGCGPPYHGNRARLRSLLPEIQALGYEIDFAGIWLSEEEKAATLPHVNRWVADFNESDPLDTRGRIIRKIRYWGTRLGIIKKPSEAEEKIDLDRWFREAWAGKVRRLQAEGKYKRVIVSYVFHSAFFNYFPKSCLKVLDTHDVFTDRDERMAALGFKADNFWFSVPAPAEKRGVMRSDVILGIQHQESDHFRKLTEGKRTVRTVGHFVETKQLPFVQGTGKVIGYLASENPLNVQGMKWFLDEVWPLVIKSESGARLMVGGGICRALEWPEDVNVLGRVERIEDLYEGCAFTVNPMLGGTGLKIKTVESLAFGRAVVSTPTGAEGVEHCIGKGLAVTGDPKEFADAVISWLKNPELAISQGKEAITTMTEFNTRSREQLKLSLEAVRHD